MALRFKSEFLSFFGSTYAVEIHDADHVGAVTTFVLGADGFTKQWTGENKERHNTILGTNISFTFLIQSLTHEAFISDLASSREGRFTLLVTKGVSPERFWAGVILPDSSRLEDAPFPYAFEVRATDGLGTLKDVPYNNAGAAYTGDERLLIHLANCLKKVPSVVAHYQTGVFLRTAIDWRDTAHAAGSTDDPIYKTYVHHGIFYDFDNDGNKEYKSCADVVHEICQILGARIVQQEGAYWVEQISIRDTAAGFKVFTYDYSVTAVGTETNSGWNQINQTASGAKLRGVTYDWFPALARVDITQHTFTRRNFLPILWTEASSPTPYTHWQEISNPNSKAVLRLTGNVALTFKNIAHASGAALLLVFNLKIKVGSKTVERTVSYQNGNYQFSTVQWVNDSPTVFAKMVHVLPIPPDVGDTDTILLPLDFTTPPLSTSGAVTFNFYLLEIRTLQTGSIQPSNNFEVKFTLKTQWLEVYTDGQPDANEDSLYFNFYSTEAGNTKKMKVETLIGDSPDTNSLGRLQIDTGGGKVNSSVWGAGTNPRNKKIVSLLGETIIAGQLKPTRRMFGVLRGDFAFWKTWKTTTDDRKWLLLGGSYNAKTHSLSGEWFEIIYRTGFNSVSPVKKKIIGVKVPDPTVVGVAGNGGIKTDHEKVGLPPGIALGALAVGTVALETGDGAITTVTVSEPVAEGAYKVGDVITIVNPATLDFQRLIVSAESEEGDTEIAVTVETGSLAVSYPEGAYVIKTQVAETQSGGGSPTWQPIRLEYEVEPPFTSLAVTIPAERLVQTIMLDSTGSGVAQIGTSGGGSQVAEDMAFSATEQPAITVNKYFKTSGSLHFSGLAGTTKIYIYAI